MKLILMMILLKAIFILILLALKVKAFTVHLCLAGKIYWRFDRGVAKPNQVDTVYTLHGGPISFVVVR